CARIRWAVTRGYFDSW
nr:immunoglobulin heavy chain junction region [Macaca mulatta]MOW32884.1 immunoglobulin heavy chain junction region [Macaca mulatta]MOW33582.1 immunoglobulin heavy chain junction region [Macaca mulatta]